MTEGAESGTLVFQVSANDLDLGLNGKVKIDISICVCLFVCCEHVKNKIHKKTNADGHSNTGSH